MPLPDSTGIYVELANFPALKQFLRALLAGQTPVATALSSAVVEETSNFTSLAATAYMQPTSVVQALFPSLKQQLSNYPALVLLLERSLFP